MADAIGAADAVAVGQLEGPRPIGVGAREGPLLVSEELAFEQVLGDGGRVDGHKRSAGAR